MNKFSLDKWIELDEKEKGKHSLKNCNRCKEIYSEDKISLPIPAQHSKKKTVKNISSPIITSITTTTQNICQNTSPVNIVNQIGFVCSTPNNTSIKNNSLTHNNSSEHNTPTQNVQNQSSSLGELSLNSEFITSSTSNNSRLLSIEIPITKSKLPYMKKVAEQVIDSIDESWCEIYNTSFTSVLRKIPSVNLTPRKSKVAKRKNVRKVHQNLKKHIENTWQADNRDVETLYGTRQSRSGHDKQRSCLFFENKAKAVARSGKYDKCKFTVQYTNALRELLCGFNFA